MTSFDRNLLERQSKSDRSNVASARERRYESKVTDDGERWSA